MVRAQASILLKTSPQRVYDFVAVDFARNYRCCSPEGQRLELLTPGPVRLGSRARQVRVDQGRRSASTRFVELEPPARVNFAENSDQFHSQYRMEPVGDQTRLTFVFELRRLDLFMRPFGKLIRAAVQEGVDRVVRNIKGLVERESPLPPGGANK